ncbi:MAG: hypothetical protein ACOYEB_13095 [Enterococcus lemanii]|jgi:hypothetical protein
MLSAISLPARSGGYILGGDFYCPISLNHFYDVLGLEDGSEEYEIVEIKTNITTDISKLTSVNQCNRLFAENV